MVGTWSISPLKQDRFVLLLVQCRGFWYSALSTGIPSVLQTIWNCWMFICLWRSCTGHSSGCSYFMAPSISTGSLAGLSSAGSRDRGYSSFHWGCAPDTETFSSLAYPAGTLPALLCLYFILPAQLECSQLNFSAWTARSSPPSLDKIPASSSFKAVIPFSSLLQLSAHVKLLLLLVHAALSSCCS
ncbi:unnamed protein product [Ilex paraguariensis]|uniref:Uncharacterized protein n=1 Tax=Ilex paraguariensis TaxID=185542 RepID=A0ABC8R616_9AQUA